MTMTPGRRPNGQKIVVALPPPKLLKCPKVPSYKVRTQEPEGGTCILVATMSLPCCVFKFEKSVNFVRKANNL